MVAMRKVQAHFIPIKITAVYLVFGALWIFITDRIIASLCENTRGFEFYQTFKGLLFVLVTGLLLYLLMRRLTAGLMRAEEELSASEKMYREVVQSANSIILRRDQEGKIIFFNEFAQRFFGFSEDEILGRNVIGTIVPERDTSGRDMAEMIAQIGLDPEAFKNNENENMLRNGDRVWVAWTNRAIRDKDGDIEAVLCIGNDITHRKRAEEALKQTNNYLENILESSPDAIVIANKHGNLIKCSRAAGEFFRESVENLIGTPVISIFAYQSELDSMLAELARDGCVKRYEINLKRKDGTLFAAEVSISLLKNAEGNTIGSIAVGRDLSETKSMLNSLWTANKKLQQEIVERESAEAALRKSESTYRTIFENTGAATVILEEDFRVSLANSEFEKLSGYPREEIEGRKRWAEFVSGDEIDAIKEHHISQKVEASGSQWKREFLFTSRRGERRNTLVTVGVIPGTRGIVASLVDVTDQKRMEQDLLRIQKLESVGILAGGIAHDFNNILTAIMGNVSLAKVSGKAGDGVLKRLDEVQKACLRARDLTYQLLTFSKGGSPVKRRSSIAGLLKQSCDLAMRGSNVRCEFHLPEGLWWVELDVLLMSQAISNIVLNAKQAMPDGGKIEISAENLIVDGHQGGFLQPGKYLRLFIRDQGVGIPPEDLPKIFDPYFTTRQGASGLGLATSYSIVRKHRGSLQVESKEGVGTTFLLYLPAAEEVALELKNTEKQRDSERGKVLIMDDEEMIRDVLELTLSKLGYEVECVADGMAAIERYKAAMDAGEPFDVVIMDLTIPGGMGGKEAILRLKEMDPQVKGIASSGYSADPVMSEFEKYGFCGVVAKPYRMEDLGKSLQHLMRS